MNDVLDRAILMAVRAHQGGKRKGSELPYILHPLEAAAIVGTMSLDPELLAAAVLHDVVEDTELTIEDIRSDFGERVADLVRAESENKREGLPAAETWCLRKQETIDALAEETRLEVKMIVLGDKLSNIRAMVNDYAQLGEALWQRFNQKDKAQHGWYYRALAEATRDLAHYPAWQEYDRLLRELFGC